MIQINNVYCNKCGTHSTAIVPTRLSEFYDSTSGHTVLVDLVECGGCGNPIKVRRVMSVVEQESLEYKE